MYQTDSCKGKKALLFAPSWNETIYFLNNSVQSYLLIYGCILYSMLVDGLVIILLNRCMPASFSKIVLFPPAMLPVCGITFLCPVLTSDLSGQEYCGGAEVGQEAKSHKILWFVFLFES